jgi:hypothetical protein
MSKTPKIDSIHKPDKGKRHQAHHLGVRSGLKLEELQLEIAHEIAMAEQAVEEYKLIAQKLTKRGLFGDLRPGEKLLAHCLDRCMKHFDANRSVFISEGNKKGRKSHAQHIWQGRAIKLSINHNKTTRVTKELPTPSLIELAGAFGARVFDCNPGATNVQMVEAGMRVLFMLTLESIFSSCAPHAEHDREERQYSRTLSAMGGRAGRRIRDASLHLNLMKDLPEEATKILDQQLLKTMNSNIDHRNESVRETVTNLSARREARDRITSQARYAGADEDALTEEIITTFRQTRALELKKWRHDALTVMTGAMLVEIVAIALRWGELEIVEKQGPTELTLNAQFEKDYDTITAEGLRGQASSWPMLVPPIPWQKATIPNVDADDVDTEDLLVEELAEDSMNQGGVNDIDPEEKVVGGYLLGSDLLVRHRTRQSHQVIDEPKNACYLQAINQLQRTAYELNPTMVKIAEHFLEHEINADSFVIAETVPRISFPDNYKLNRRPDSFESDYAEQKWEDERAEQLALKEVSERQWAQETGRRLHTTVVVNQLKRFKDRPFYHAWNFCSRGRKYTLATVLSPLGPDWERSLLRAHKKTPVEGTFKFDDGTEIKITRKNTLDAARIDLAIKHGEAGKASFDERIQWGIDNEEMILAIGKDPLGSTSLWADKDLDEPWQFVAACEEFYRIKVLGQSFCRIFGSMDATSSGLQHLAAGTFDGELAPLVNISNGMERGDIYKVVAARANELTDERVKAKAPYYKVDPRLASDRLPYDWEIKRASAKPPTMTLPYGSTYQNCVNNLEKLLMQPTPEYPKGTPWLKPHVPIVPLKNEDGEIIRYRSGKHKGEEKLIGVKEIDPRFYAFVKSIWDSCGEKLARPLMAMDFMRTIFTTYSARQISLRAEDPTRWDEPLVFTSPSGFPCTFFKPTKESGKDSEFSLRVKLPNLSNGSTRQLDLTRYNYRRCDWSGIRKQIAPGIIHAIDGALLDILLVNHWSKEYPLSVVHDALFAPWPLMMAVARQGRESFYDIHKEGSFLESFAKQALDEQPDELAHLLNELETKVIDTSDDAWEPKLSKEAEFMFS